MAFWSQDINGFAESLRPGGSFLILDDLLSLVIISFVSAVEISISFSILHFLRHRGNTTDARSSRIFGIVSISLGTGYLLYTILSISTFCTKLQFAASLIKENGSPQLFSCPSGYVALETTGFCGKPEKLSAFQSIKTLAFFHEVLLYLMLLFADGLLIYRCHILLETRRIIFFMACSPLVISFMYFLLTSIIAQMNEHQSTSSLLIGIYVSLLTNLIVSITLLVRVWRVKRMTDSALGSSRRTTIPYQRLMTILLESAVPPLILGLIHLGLRLATFKTIVPGLGMLWGYSPLKQLL